MMQREGGLCLCCQKEVRFRTKFRRKRTDEWYDRLAENWTMPIKFSIDPRTGFVRINNYARTKLIDFICKECYVQLEATCRTLEGREQRQIRFRKNTTRVSADDIAKLRILPYKQYLKTEWWQHVRRNIFRERGKVCDGCGQIEGKLTIHHLTYKWFGRELEHRECLRILCPKCHYEAHPELKARE